jgi:predicted ATPase
MVGMARYLPLICLSLLPCARAPAANLIHITSPRRCTSSEILAETYNDLRAKIQKLPNPSADAVRIAFDMMSDQFPQAKNVNPNEVIDISFLK